MNRRRFFAALLPAAAVSTAVIDATPAPTPVLEPIAPFCYTCGCTLLHPKPQDFSARPTDPMPSGGPCMCGTVHVVPFYRDVRVRGEG